MAQFKGGRDIYEAFLYKKGVLILIVLSETRQNKRRKVTHNIHFSFRFVYLKLLQNETKQKDTFFCLVIHEILKLIFFLQ